MIEEKKCNICIEEICSICQNDDFGYCGLRNSKEGMELKFKHDEHLNIIKCSGFYPDCSKLKMIFKLKEREQEND